MRDRVGQQFFRRHPSSSSPAPATKHLCSPSAPSTHPARSTEHVALLLRSATMASPYAHHNKYAQAPQRLDSDVRLPSLKDLNFQYGSSPPVSALSTHPPPQDHQPSQPQQDHGRHAWGRQSSASFGMAHQQHTPPLSAGAHHDLPQSAKAHDYPTQKHPNGGYAHPGIPLSAQVASAPTAFQSIAPRTANPPPFQDREKQAHSPVVHTKRLRPNTTMPSASRDVRAPHSAYAVPQYSTYPQSPQVSSSNAHPHLPSGVPAAPSNSHQAQTTVMPTQPSAPPPPPSTHSQMHPPQQHQQPIPTAYSYAPHHYINSRGGGGGHHPVAQHQPQHQSHQQSQSSHASISSSYRSPAAPPVAPPPTQQSQGQWTQQQQHHLQQNHAAPPPAPASQLQSHHPQHQQLQQHASSLHLQPPPAPQRVQQQQQPPLQPPPQAHQQPHLTQAQQQQQAQQLPQQQHTHINPSSMHYRPPPVSNMPTTAAPYSLMHQTPATQPSPALPPQTQPPQHQPSHQQPHQPVQYPQPPPQQPVQPPPQNQHQHSQQPQRYDDTPPQQSQHPQHSSQQHSQNQQRHQPQHQQQPPFPATRSTPIVPTVVLSNQQYTRPASAAPAPPPAAVSYVSPTSGSTESMMDVDVIGTSNNHAAPVGANGNVNVNGAGPSLANTARAETIAQLNQHCGALYNFANQYAQHQSHSSRQPTQAELEVMAQRAQLVLRLLEDLRRINLGLPPLPPAQQAPQTHSQPGHHGQVQQQQQPPHGQPIHAPPPPSEDPRPPKRPWEDISQDTPPVAAIPPPQQAQGYMDHSRSSTSDGLAGASGSGNGNGNPNISANGTGNGNSGGSASANGHGQGTGNGKVNGNGNGNGVLSNESSSSSVVGDVPVGAKPVKGGNKTTAEQDMEMIRTKRATSSAGASAQSGAQKSKYRKRSRATPPGKCHSCNIRETPEWRRGPDGARTLCNACGLHYAKLMRKRDKNGADGPRIDLETLRASARATDIEKANRSKPASSATAGPIMSRQPSVSSPDSPMDTKEGLSSQIQQQQQGLMHTEEVYGQPQRTTQYHQGSFQLTPMLAPESGPGESASTSGGGGGGGPGGENGARTVGAMNGVTAGAAAGRAASGSGPSTGNPQPTWVGSVSAGPGSRPGAYVSASGPPAPEHLQHQSFMRGSQR